MDSTRGKTKTAVVSIALVLLHWAVLCLRLNPASLFTDEPLYQLNYGKYFYTIETASKLLANYGAPWGFDPRFAAGHILMPGVYQGLLLLVFLTHAVPSISPAASIKLFIFLSLFLFPVVLWWAIRAFGLPQKVVPWGLTIAFLITYFSATYLDISTGFITIYSSVLVLVASLALLWDINRSRQKPLASVLVMGSSGLLIYFISPPMNIIALMGYAAFWIAQEGDFWKPRSLLALALGLVAVALIAYPWLSLSLPFLYRNADIIAQMTKSPLFPWRAGSLILCIVVFFIAPIAVVNIVAAISGMRSYPAGAVKQKRFLIMLTCSLTAVILLMFALIAAALLFPEHAELLTYVEGALYPSRYTESLILFMIIPASLGVQLWHESMARARREKRRSARRSTAILYSVFLLVLVGAVSLFPGQKRSFQVRAPTPFMKMVEWM
ncbi:MAG TPA: hypothetical protein ENF73_00825, partial [Proteobacteria bacterium]|nr:hypothetical protein [Pseudomonadota bacterium]